MPTLSLGPVLHHLGQAQRLVQKLKKGGYQPRDYYEADPHLKEAIDQIATGFFSPDQPDLFQPLVNSLLGVDPFLVLADFAAYVECQKRVSQAYGNQEAWTRKSILNTARMGYFSSDRAIRDYCERIWRAKAEPIALDA